MKKFLVMYLAPTAVLDDWAKLAPETRKVAEDKMRGEWQQWMATHSKMVKDTHGGSKTKLISTTGVSDTRNEIMICSTIEAESFEAATKVFENHPHLGIPSATIQVMELRSMSGM